MSTLGPSPQVSIPMPPQPQTAQQIIELLDLKPHPEGGFFKETFRDDDYPESNGRAASTLIYYLLRRGDHSKLHRIDAAEAWHHYAGGSLQIIELSTSGPKVTKLGSDLMAGERPQYVVDKGKWFGAKPSEGTNWVLVGCSVAPGFEMERFEMGQRDDLMKNYPNCEKWIGELTSAT